MIKLFRHKGLERFFETGKPSGIQSKHGKRLKMQLTALSTAQSVQDMELPGYVLHPLKGKQKGRWSIRVSGNWRLTFRFEDGDVHVVNYEDYH